MREKICWAIGLVLVFGAIALKAENKLQGWEVTSKVASGEESRIDYEKNSTERGSILKSEIISSGRDNDADRIECSRYCVRERISGEETRNDSTKRVHIIWNIMNEPRVTGQPLIIRGLSSSLDNRVRWESSKKLSDKSGNFHNDLNCQLYVELGCKSPVKSGSNISTVYDEYPTFHYGKPISVGHLVGKHGAQFNVDDITKKLNIFAIGNLSQVALEIPLATRVNDSTNARGTRPTFSLSRTNDAEGLLIVARNPPAGEWLVMFSGMKNANYRFNITFLSKDALQNVLIKNDPIKPRPPMNEDVVDNGLSAITVNQRVQVAKSQRLVDPRTSDDNKIMINSDDKQLLLEAHSNNVPKAVKPTITNESAARSIISRETKNLPRFPEKSDLEAEVMENDIKESDENARILVGSEFDELSRGVEDSRLKIHKTVVDISPSAELIARPQTLHDVLFRVTNNQPLAIRHVFKGSSTQFPYVGVLPYFDWIRAGETIDVRVRIQVPNVQDDTPNTVTLYVGGNENLEVVEKSAYVYVQGSSGAITADSESPNIDYTFNDNCAGKLNTDRCAKSLWSVDITVVDSESGLKRVTSIPSGVQPRTEFITGTKNAVSFTYISTCCFPTMDITATDVQGNTYTRTVDVRAWDNLSNGEIAAIVVGALLILFLIIFIILLIIYCIRKRKSHDLTYSQRYGSRTPTSTERTNF